MMNEPFTAPAAAPAGPAGAPALYIVRGQPTADEVAAVVAVLVARADASAATSSGQPGPATAPRSEWSDRKRLLRDALTPGPGAWRRSSLPR